MKKIAVLAGGISSEHDVSLMTARGVLAALKRLGYEAYLIYVSKDIETLVSTLADMKPDVVFNALHGTFGEDGCMQGLLNMMQIPYTHSGVMASSVAMHKKTAKVMFERAEIPVAIDKMVTLHDLKKGDTLPYPYVIKPDDEGSSIGVHIIESAEDERHLMENWPFGGSSVLMEQYIPGREFTVTVMGDRALAIIELAPKTGFYDYDHKYTSGMTDHIVPAPLTKKEEKMFKEYALRAHRILGCRGVTRCDFRYDESNDEHPHAVILELNSQPGMTALSLAPEAAKAEGISFDGLVEYLIKEAACEK